MAGDRASYGQGVLLVVSACDDIINHRYTSDQPNDKGNQPRRSQPFILGTFGLLVNSLYVPFVFFRTESSLFLFMRIPLKEV